MSLLFEAYPKTPRLFRDVVISEKIDGTNACVMVVPSVEVGAGDVLSVAQVDGYHLFAGSRSRWITPGKTTDNYGFAQWVQSNAEELVKLGPGRHYGEWWGAGIQRGYPIGEKRFSLFNVDKWQDDALRPKCCHVVPVLYRGEFRTDFVEFYREKLRVVGSYAAPGYMKPEGLIVFHTAAQRCFKVLLENDEGFKGE